MVVVRDERRPTTMAEKGRVSSLVIFVPQFGSEETHLIIGIAEGEHRPFELLVH